MAVESRIIRSIDDPRRAAAHPTTREVCQRAAQPALRLPESSTGLRRREKRESRPCATPWQSSRASDDRRSTPRSSSAHDSQGLLACCPVRPATPRVGAHAVRETAREPGRRPPLTSANGHRGGRSPRKNVDDSQITETEAPAPLHQSTGSGQRITPAGRRRLPTRSERELPYTESDGQRTAASRRKSTRPNGAQRRDFLGFGNLGLGLGVALRLDA